MAPQDEPTFEAEHEVLADRLDPDQAPPVEALGGKCRGCARVRRLDGEPLPNEHLQAPRCAVERITLRHRRQG
jgi:hypothetical protein